MSFALGPLPDAFALAAWARIASEIDASPAIKAALQVEVIKLHRQSASQRESIRCLGAVLHKQQWNWARGRELLLERLGEEPLAEDLLEAMYHWFTLSTHKLHRRGQIRAVLAQDMGHVIQVSVVEDEGGSIPCGAYDQQILTPNKEILQRMPPCNHPFCRCSWMLVHPD